MAEHASLTLEEYRRYGRQMILRGFGLPGQLKLKNARVAIIGAGGLGCPALQYLAGAGVGTIGIFDFDTVEESNLHRQVLHTTARVGDFKADSAKEALAALNPHVQIESHTLPLLPSTSIPLLSSYNLVLDCTDRPQTRYLINDACVRLGIPLVSGAAIEWNGQWCVLGGWHQAGLPGFSITPADIPTSSSSSSSPPSEEALQHRPRSRWTPEQTKEKTRRPCYRCLFPQPLPRANDKAGTCEEEGVFGPIVGVVGVQMAAEAIKVILGVDDPQPKLNLISLSPNLTPEPNSTSTPFRSIRVRGPSPKCRACGPDGDVTDDLEAVGYDEFCGVSTSSSKGTGAEETLGDGGEAEVQRISVEQLKEGFFGGRIPDRYFTALEPPLSASSQADMTRTNNKMLIDVREELEYGLCYLPGSANIPMQTFLHDPIGQIRSRCTGGKVPGEIPSEIFLVCRRGNDSLVSARALRAALDEKGGDGKGVMVKDVVGGVRAWSSKVDPGFPMY